MSSIDPCLEPAMTSAPDERNRLRRQLRQKRRDLTPMQQQRAAIGLCRQLKTQPLFVRSRHIAVYLPNDGEIDPRPLIEVAWQLGKHIYLPIVGKNTGQKKNRRLQFQRFDPHTQLFNNRFGIAEPKFDPKRLRKAQHLDLVLMPLVGFDATGGRMGMGGGFYDCTFAFRKNHSRLSPSLIGLAHECQQVDQLSLASWDIPLDAIATDRRLIITRSSQRQRNFRP